MLTLDEVNAAWQAKGLTFAGPASDGDTSCEYSEPDIDLPGRVDIDFWAYDPTSDYGFGTDHTTSWIAPNAEEGVANARAAAVANTTSDQDAI
ncbi:hypothetical protein [Naasia lichenicola]|uniref:Uncharacterized protein n=1 Tax=Naasia lichenicola TaxID=2565933 RepID=A0A4S4FP37_9MICO|nr:hypothetical protein [Naasia lichenicola]THG30781.1 hypothetical protein E6C64_09080 [Naasia lichenicola]THG32018.1 hypothetical protein E6C64_08225 [Naasia lichenicola]